MKNRKKKIVDYYTSGRHKAWNFEVFQINEFDEKECLIFNRLNIEECYVADSSPYYIVSDEGDQAKILDAFKEDPEFCRHLQEFYFK